MFTCLCARACCACVWAWADLAALCRTVPQLFKEVIQGIRVVKSYGWEESFMKAIHDVRQLEAAQLRLNAVAMAVILPISLTIPAAAVCVTFVLRVIFKSARCCMLVSVAVWKDTHTCAVVTPLQAPSPVAATASWLLVSSLPSSCRSPLSPWASPT